MKDHLQKDIFAAALNQVVSQMARKYGDELIFQTWSEIRMAGDDEIFLRVCGWKAELTLAEALGFLQDYCDFIEARIRKTLNTEQERIDYNSILFN